MVVRLTPIFVIRISVILGMRTIRYTSWIQEREGNVHISKHLADNEKDKSSKKMPIFALLIVLRLLTMQSITHY